MSPQHLHRLLIRPHARQHSRTAHQHTRILLCFSNQLTRLLPHLLIITALTVPTLRKLRKQSYSLQIRGRCFADVSVREDGVGLPEGDLGAMLEDERGALVGGGEGGGAGGVEGEDVLVLAGVEGVVEGC